MRYVYGFTAALLLGGTAATLTLNPAGAQVAQNDPATVAAVPRPGAPPSFADLVARLQPAVVNISTEQSITIPRRRALPPGFEEFFRRFGGEAPQGGEGETITQRGGSLGSGFIISPDGYIVTNNHVVAPARPEAVVEQIQVTLHDGTEYDAEVVGRDPESDLAVLRIRPRGSLPFVRFAQSNQLRVGDWVIAIGNPFTLGGTVTAGIVSALHRSIGGAYDRYIQTDASINSGNSGGPMFDLHGNVVGINTALISPTGGNVGIGFAIPAEQALPVIDALRRGERVERGYVGITIQELDEPGAAALGIPENSGALIQEVRPDGPAARAGIQPGDVVLSVGGQAVSADRNLAALIAEQRVGTRVPFVVLRNGQRRTLQVAITQRPTQEELAALIEPQTDEQAFEERKPEDEQTSSQRSAQEGLGLSVRTLTPAIARQLGLTGGEIRGVVIDGVDPNSDAARRGLRVGDIILSINQRATPTPDEAAAAVAAAREAGRSAVLLLVRRGNGRPAYVGVQLTR